MLTHDYLESLIVDEQYFRFPNTTVTVCCLTLQNGMGVIGEAGCLPTTPFNPAVGRETARDRAFDKLWELEGYLARQMLMMQQDPQVQANIAKLEAADRDGAADAGDTGAADSGDTNTGGADE